MDTKCPKCKKEVKAKNRIAGVWPFCSERCKHLDFGGWVNEEYQIAGRELILEEDDDMTENFDNFSLD